MTIQRLYTGTMGGTRAATDHTEALKARARDDKIPLHSREDTIINPN